MKAFLNSQTYYPISSQCFDKISWKHQNIKGFLMFSGRIKRGHWENRLHDVSSYVNGLNGELDCEKWEKWVKWQVNDQVKIFKGCFPQILLGPFLNTLTHMIFLLHMHFSLQINRSFICSLEVVKHIASIFQPKIFHTCVLMKKCSFMLRHGSIKHLSNI